MTHPIVLSFLKGETDAGGTIRALELEVEHLQRHVNKLEAAKHSVRRTAEHVEPDDAKYQEKAQFEQLIKKYLKENLKVSVSREGYDDQNLMVSITLDGEEIDNDVVWIK